MTVIVFIALYTLAAFTAGWTIGQHVQERRVVRKLNSDDVRKLVPHGVTARVKSYLRGL